MIARAKRVDDCDVSRYYSSISSSQSAPEVMGMSYTHIPMVDAFARVQHTHRGAFSLVAAMQNGFTTTMMPQSVKVLDQASRLYLMNAMGGCLLLQDDRT